MPSETEPRTASAGGPLLSGFVVVSGLPASGKTTVASLLAPALRLPLLSKDTIKEALAEVLPVRSVGDSARLGAASFEVLYALLTRIPAAVLEANWNVAIARRRFLELHTQIVEVHCSCPEPLRTDRFRLRATEGRHRVHREHYESADPDASTSSGGDAEALAIGPVIPVETGRNLDVDALVAAILASARR